MQQGWLRSGIIVLFLGVIFCYWLPVAASTSTCPEGGKCIFNDTGPILIKSQKGDIKLQATSTLNNIYLNYVDTASYGLGVSAGGALYHNGNVIVVADGEFYGISISGLSGGLLGQIGTYAPEDLLKLKNSQQVFTFSTSTAYWGVNDITHSVNGLSNIYSWLTTNLVGQLAFVRDSDSTSSRQYLQYRFNNVNSPNDWDEWTEVCDISNNCRNFFNVSLDNNSNNSLVMYQDPDILIDSGLKVIDPSLLSDCSNLYTSSGVIGCGSGGGGGGGGLSGLGTANYLSKWSDTSTLADSILYEDSNKIGLGTTSPYTQLHIYNNSEGPIISLSGLDIKYRGLTIKDTNNSEKWFVGNNDSNNFVIRATGSNDILTVGASSGNVGIGTASPEEQLTITKNFRLSPTTHENLNGIIYKDGNRFIHDFNYGYSGSTTTVGQNTFIGINAGNLTMGEGVISPFQASYNVGVGASAFTSNTSGNYNTAVGASSLYSNTSGANNTAFGYSALTSNMSGNYNTAVGASSLYSNTSGYNTAVGYASLYSNISGNYNTAVGASSLYSNTSSYNNTAVGASSLYSNISGSYNTAVGASSLYSNTSSDNNTAIGYYALYSNISDYNTAVGASALRSNISGSYNTAFGYSALRSNTSSYSNTALGFYALYSNISGSNTAVGDSALRSNISGNSNTAVGTLALYSNISGSYNTAVGASSLRSNTSSDNNTALGYYALYNNKAGSNNVAVGIRAGNLVSAGSALTKPTNSIFLGAETKAQLDDQTNQIVIGVNAIGAGSNSVVLGNTSITKTLLRGDIGIGTSSPATKLHIYDASSGPIITLSGLDTNYRGLVIKDTSDAEKWFIGSNTSTNTNFVIRATSSNDILTVGTSNGNVGIGTMPDDIVKLNVAGTIKTNLTTTTEGISRCLYVDQDGVISAKTSDCGTDSSSISGSGTDNYLTKWSNANTLGTSTIYDNGTNVSIGTTSSEGTLMVSGTGYFTGTLKVATPATSSDAVNVSYLMEAMKSTHDVIFAGHTGPYYNGDNGGYDNANAICDTAYDGSHICTTEDILRIINSGNVNSIPTTTIGYWIVNGPPAYKANANDCVGFTASSSAMLGNVWIRPPEYPNSFGILRHCNQEHQFACCKYIYD